RVAAFIVFLAADLALLGQICAGTVGPLGYAKVIVAAGAFDRCVVRHVHLQIVGRDIDPTKEAGYLDSLTASFVAGGRKVRPLVKTLTQSEPFRNRRPAAVAAPAPDPCPGTQPKNETERIFLGLKPVCESCHVT